MNDESTKNTKKPATGEAPLLKYEVTAKMIKIGGCLCYRTARVNLTQEQADAINKAQPDSVKFLGV